MCTQYWIHLGRLISVGYGVKIINYIIYQSKSVATYIIYKLPGMGRPEYPCSLLHVHQLPVWHIGFHDTSESNTRTLKPTNHVTTVITLS